MNTKTLEEQNAWLRKAYIRQSKGRTMYERDRIRYYRLSAQLEQRLKELAS